MRSESSNTSLPLSQLPRVPNALGGYIGDKLASAIPIIQQRNRELDIQEGELMRKAEADRAKASINQQKIKSDVLKQVMKLQSDQKIEGAELGVRIGEALLEASIKEERPSIS